MTNINTTKNYRFYIGLNDKDTGKQLLSINQVTNIIDKVFECYTIINAQGRYKYFDGHFENENTLIIEFFDLLNEIKDKKTLKNIIHYLKTQLNQELILVEITKVNIDMQ